MSTTRRMRDRRGYTAVEVLISMTLFAIGAAGVIGMMRATVQGGEDARSLDIATNIAHEWVGRLQRDAMSWTLPTSQNRYNTNVFTATRWLTQVQLATCNPPNFCTPQPDPATPEGFSYAFDYAGRDRPPDSQDHYYCVQYRLWWGRPLGTGAPFNEQATIHADIRVLWKRIDQVMIKDCKTLPTGPIQVGDPSYHVIYASTVLRSNQESQP